MKTIDDIKMKQKTIDSLLEMGEFNVGDMKWVLEPLCNDSKFSVGIVDIGKKTLGPCEEHLHLEAKEYLICVSGGFVLNINGNDVRKLYEGDCAVVNPGELHYSTPLFDNTKIVYVCVPADKGMSLLEKQFRRSDG